MPIRHQLLYSLLTLALILAIFEATPIDVWLQNYFYDASATDLPALERWAIYKHDPTLEFWLHNVAKIFTIVIGVCAFLLYAASFAYKRLARYRHGYLFLGVSLGLVAFFVGGAKHITNVYCPNQLTIYGGDKPYVKVLEPYPADFKTAKKGRCYPAGHATTGFGFMALYFLFRRRGARLAGLAFGVSYGWALGIFQMLRGEHFLSHTLFSMVASWAVILLIVIAFDRMRMAPTANPTES